MVNGLRRFFISADFYKSLTFIVAALLPILAFQFLFDRVELGFALALGVFYNSPTNIAGSVKHRTIGMMVAIGLTTMATLIIGYAAKNLWVLLPVLGIVTFAYSYISIYGFRASLVSLSGMLAVVISFANSYVNLSVAEYAGLIFLGGIWYLGVSSLFNFINPKLYIEELLADSIELTAKYFETRAKLLIEKNNREDLQRDLFQLQSELTEKHESLRVVILSRRQKSGFSNRIRRKLLIFIELVDVLELAIANPVNYNKLDQLFKDETKYIHAFADLIFEMARELEIISKTIIKGEKVQERNAIRTRLKEVRMAIDTYKKTHSSDEAKDGLYILINLFDYQSEQARKIESIERVMNVLKLNDKFTSKKQDDDKFIKTNDYGYRKLVENFNFKSNIFSHSVRLAITMVIGFLFGKLFEFQNPYWILITLLVIMRPSYGLTKERVKNRVIGTLIGSLLGVVLVFFIKSTTAYSVLAAVSLVLALSLVQLNYATFAVFITLHIIFMYALYNPDVLAAVKFRIIDTVLGASLATIANLFLFPSWEFLNIEENTEEAIKKTKIYLKEIDEKYHTKKPVSVAYKLARKEAFLAIGDLNAAFQRMTQEPKSKQKHFAEIYEIVVLANTFLSSLASLGTYIRNHKTTAVSKSVEVFVENINLNLKNAIEVIQNHKIEDIQNELELEKAAKSLEEKYIRLSRNFDTISETLIASQEEKENLSLEIQETKMVLEQLSYLYNLSKKLVQKVSVYKSKL